MRSGGKSPPEEGPLLSELALVVLRARATVPPLALRGFAAQLGPVPPTQIRRFEVRQVPRPVRAWPPYESRQPRWTQVGVFRWCGSVLVTEAQASRASWRVDASVLAPEPAAQALAAFLRKG